MVAETFRRKLWEAPASRLTWLSPAMVVVHPAWLGVRRLTCWPVARGFSTVTFTRLPSASMETSTYPLGPVRGTASTRRSLLLGAMVGLPGGAKPPGASSTRSPPA